MLSKRMREAWKRPADSPGWRALLMGLRREPAISRLDGPTRPERARSLGYKAKKGFVVVRARVPKGKRKTPKKGRRSPKASGRFFTTGLSLQAIAEQRVARRFSNLEVMNSYQLAEDGQHRWFEVILADTSRSEVRKDRERQIAGRTGRAFRGKTSAARKSRGLLRKGKGAEKLRPSLRARSGRGK